MQDTGVNSSCVSWTGGERNPEWGKFCSFLFLSILKDVLYAKDILVESEETLFSTHPRWDPAHLHDRKTLEG